MHRYVDTSDLWSPYDQFPGAPSPDAIRPMGRGPDGIGEGETDAETQQKIIETEAKKNMWAHLGVGFVAGGIAGYVLCKVLG